MIRSASTVCSFAMKYFGWSLTRALSHTKVNQNIPLKCFLWNLACSDVILPLFVQERRSIINPNSGFREQLRIYEGILEVSQTHMQLHFLHNSNHVRKSISHGIPQPGEPTAKQFQGDQAFKVRGFDEEESDLDEDEE